MMTLCDTAEKHLTHPACANRPTAATFHFLLDRDRCRLCSKLKSEALAGVPRVVKHTSIDAYIRAAKKLQLQALATVGVDDEVS
jgi:hypothetical protein